MRRLRVDTFLKAGESKEPVGWKHSTLNNWAVLLHSVQCVVMFALASTEFNDRAANVPYVSAKQDLRMTHHAMTRTHDTPEDQCADVRNSPMFNVNVKNTFPEGLMDRTYLYDFNDTFAVEFNQPAVQVNTAVLMGFFFLLSAVFQSCNGWVLNAHALKNLPYSYPRVINLVEYSFSSSLMIMVMGINLGIYELFHLLGLCGLFFAMNLFGVCAEIMCHCVERAGPSLVVNALWCTQHSMWMIPHFAGWVVFLVAYTPLLIKYFVTLVCSHPMIPWFVTTAVVLETVCFFLFGIVQWWGLQTRMRACRENRMEDVKQKILVMDLCYIMLSLFAKTSLAWLLMGPALAMSKDRWTAQCWGMYDAGC